MSLMKIGVAGPVGCGKTALILRLVQEMRQEYRLCVVTNDIYTEEDANFLKKHSGLTADSIRGVETGGCPHTAIRDDCSMNLEAIDDLVRHHPETEIVFVESGGDNLSATFSPDLVDATIFVIDVAGGGDIPRKGGPGITRSDLLVINKTDLAPHVGVDLERMRADTEIQRGERPFIMTSVKAEDGHLAILDWLRRHVLFADMDVK